MISMNYINIILFRIQHVVCNLHNKCNQGKLIKIISKQTLKRATVKHPAAAIFFWEIILCKRTKKKKRISCDLRSMHFKKKKSLFFVNYQLRLEYTYYMYNCILYI